MRFHFAISNRGGRRYLPYAYTEQGVAMLSSVLSSQRAVQMNILIIRAFIKLRGWYLTGAYGNGKTHLLYAQCREIVISGKVYCHVRTTRELVEKLRRAEFEEDFVLLVIAAASRRALYHFFWG